MGNSVDRLFQEWHRMGGAVLVAEADPATQARPPEELLAESTQYCRDSGRLTWVIVDWLIRHAEEINEEALLQRTREQGELSVLGVLCDAAYQRNRHAMLERVMRACAPHPEMVPFFHRVARSPLALRLTRENALELFRRWNYLCAELRYLVDEGAGLAKGAKPAA